MAVVVCVVGVGCADPEGKGPTLVDAQKELADLRAKRRADAKSRSASGGGKNKKG